MEEGTKMERGLEGAKTEVRGAKMEVRGGAMACEPLTCCRIFLSTNTDGGLPSGPSTNTTEPTI